jgi:hypothetical protein
MPARISLAFLRDSPYGGCVMVKFRALDPVADLEIVMTMMAAIVTEHLPGYRGKISLEFCHLPYPEGPRARFRGNVFVEAPVGPRWTDGFDRLMTSSAIALEMDLALQNGWLDYDGDLLLTLHAVPSMDGFIVRRKNGRVIAFEFGK